MQVTIEARVPSESRSPLANRQKFNARLVLLKNLAEQCEILVLPWRRRHCRELDFIALPSRHIYFASGNRAPNRDGVPKMDCF
jgi:hypothetical protein